MKKNIMLLFLSLSLALTSSANAYFIKENSDEQLVAKVIDEYVYVAHKQGEKITLVNNYGVKWSEMRKAMRINTYLEKSILGYSASYLAMSVTSSMMLGVINPVVGLGGVLATKIAEIEVIARNDDGTQYLFELSPIGLLGLGERIVRGKRLKNFVSSKSFEINENRFNKIIEIIPTLDVNKSKSSSVEIFN